MTGWSCNKVKSPFIHQRTWPRICIPGNIRENLLMVQWNEIFHGEPSASSHPARKDWGEDGRGNHWNSFFFFFLQFSLFPPSALPAESHSSLGSWGSALLPLPQSCVGHTAGNSIQTPSPHLLVCRERKERTETLWVWKRCTKLRQQDPLEKATRFLSPRQKNFNYLTFSGSEELLPGIWREQDHALSDGKALLKPLGYTKARKSHSGKPQQLILSRVMGKGEVRGHPCALWV